MFTHHAQLKTFLDEQLVRFNHPDFIVEDPISIPHRYSRREDIEISAFFAATIAWGQRKTIVNNAGRLMDLMDNAPFEFIAQHDDSDLQKLRGFVHRTFQESDLYYFIHALREIYRQGGLEPAFCTDAESGMDAICRFRDVFFAFPHENRTQKHVSDPRKGASAKRLNMFLRWMVRKDEQGVDFGLWKGIAPSQLSVPLDVHTGNIARKLGMLQRSQNDRKAVEELDDVLRSFDPKDPVKYDFALFGLGVEGF